MKSRLIVNPTAGGGSIMSALVEVNRQLRSLLGDVDIVLTSAGGDANRAAAEAVADGREGIFIAGGDGTLNEAINGVSSIAGALDRVVFGVIPCGTGNDFAASLGLPPDPLGAVDAIRRDDPVTVDLAQIDEMLFINVSVGGFVARATGALSPQLKAVAGKFAYMIAGMQALLDDDETSLTVHSAGGSGPDTVAMNVRIFAICNAARAGGGKLIAPQARLDDGLLDAVFVQSMPIPEMMALIPKFLGGEEPEDPRIVRFTASSLDLTFRKPAHINTDGEPGEYSKARYRVLPAAARFFHGPTSDIAGTGA